MQQAQALIIGVPRRKQVWPTWHLLKLVAGTSKEPRTALKEVFEWFVDDFPVEEQLDVKLALIAGVPDSSRYCSTG